MLLNNITLHLTPDDLLLLIAQQVRAELGREVETVSFDIKTVSSGYGTQEYDEKVFSGATVKLSGPITSQPAGLHYRSLGAALGAQ